MAALYADTIGRGSPPLLLLHGLSVNGAVWQPLLPALREWPGRIIIPDLRGHGRSPHVRPYALGQHACDVASLLNADEPVTIVGHSMGAMIGLVLASGLFGVDVAHVLALGTKVTWQEDELVKLKQVAASPVRWFDTHAEAVERFLRMAGLAGIVDSHAAVVDVGVRSEGSRFRLAADPATVLVVGPEFGPVLSAARATWQLACGDNDSLVGIAELRAFDTNAVEIAGSGHNPHIQAPLALAGLILGALRRTL
jgi:pimeloyl-ACP methyl ester carboxylesterase